MPALPATPSSRPAAPPGPPSPWRPWLRHGLQVAVANAGVAGLIAALHGGRFVQTLVYAEAIGLLVWIVVEAGRHWLPRDEFNAWPRGWRAPALVAVACIAGWAGGTTLGNLVYGRPGWAAFSAHPADLLADFGLTAVFGTIIVGWFHTRSRALALRARAAAAAHEATLARLVLLQSQLEPHMLFNTLANLRALIGVDAQRAQDMLDRLIDFLRATLAASRVPAHPLSDEFARVGDYLALMQVRMGTRLVASTALPADLATAMVPPLLLQPLVENAIKHGLEPQRGAGALRVEARREAEVLVLAVVDSGRGLAASAAARDADSGTAGAGFGVEQVRERLHTLHGAAASFTLAPEPGGGTRAEIRMPLAAGGAGRAGPATPAAPPAPAAVQR